MPVKKLNSPIYGARDRRSLPPATSETFMVQSGGSFFVKNGSFMTEGKPNKKTIDFIDVVFLIGLALLGIGLWFAFSWPVALVVIGSILVIVSLWISTPSRKGER